MEDKEALRRAIGVVDNYHSLSASHLSEWSHREGSPWKKAVYRDNTPAWGREIDKKDVESFFRNPNWNQGLSILTANTPRRLMILRQYHSPL